MNAKDYRVIDYISEIKDKFDLIVTKRSVDAKNKEELKTICEEINIEIDNITSNNQVHSDIVNIITDKNISQKSEGDALITNLKNVPLLVFTADCVPIAIMDTKNKAIGLVHSGWRGTFDKISEKTIKAMQENYGTNPEDLICVILPSIGKCCYCVSDDLAQKFYDKFSNICSDVYEIREEGCEIKVDTSEKEASTCEDEANNCEKEASSCEKEANNCEMKVNTCEIKSEKPYLNLWEINKAILLESGVKEENIYVEEICTSCHCNEYFSYRKNDKTGGRIGTILQIREI
jgi:YfiH family protein